MGRLIGVIFVISILIGCSDGDRFDQIQCADGNGDVYLLKHRLGDTYFIDNLSEEYRSKECDHICQANKKLKENPND